MKPIIQTNRLFLRELTIDDALSFYNLNLNTEVIKYTGDKAFDSVEKAREFLENYNPYQKYNYGRWAVIEKSTNEFLGWCGLKYSPELDEVDIGFRFFKKYWNQGFATESAKACLEYGFEKLQLSKIVGRAMEENIASIKVLEKIGMTFSKKCEFELHKGVLYEIVNLAQ
jgi:[ribosomal protein S5]-alanine N-acetyltransferase